VFWDIAWVSLGASEAALEPQAKLKDEIGDKIRLRRLRPML
jgi:hypothetical protein